MIVNIEREFETDSERDPCARKTCVTKASLDIAKSQTNLIDYHFHIWTIMVGGRGHLKCSESVRLLLSDLPRWFWHIRMRTCYSIRVHESH